MLQSIQESSQLAAGQWTIMFSQSRDGLKAQLLPVPETEEAMKRAINDLMMSIYQMNRQIGVQQDEISYLKTQAGALANLQLEKKALEELVTNLQRRLENQQAEIDELKVALNAQGEKITSLEGDRARHVRDIRRLTVREVCRALEAAICLEIAGSKRKAKSGMFNFQKVKSFSTAADSDLTQTLLALGLNDTNLIERLKDDGDKFAHSERQSDMLTAAQFRAQIAEDEDDDEEKAEKENLVRALFKFGMVDPQSGTINLAKPF